MTPKIQKLLRALAAAEDAVEAELRLEFPEGTRVAFMLYDTQINLSHGHVIGVNGGRSGSLNVRMDGGHVTRVSMAQLHARY